MNVHGTIDGFNVFDQFDYTVMDFFFFCIGGKGREHHMFTSITVCVEYNIYIFFCLFVNFHNLFLLNNPKGKKKEKKIEENHKIGMHY